MSQPTVGLQRGFRSTWRPGRQHLFAGAQRSIRNAFPTRAVRPAWRDSIWDRIVASEVDAGAPLQRLGYYAITASSKGLPARSGRTTSNFTPRPGQSGFNPRKPPLLRLPQRWTPYFAGVLGDVYDPGAAMLGGVCGHAGLFGNAYDVARLMYMLRMGGTWRRGFLSTGNHSSVDPTRGSRPGSPKGLWF